MSETVKIVVVGSINMDIVIQAAHLPMPGETVLGGDYQTYPGGKGANQAVAAAKLGAETTMLGAVGSDAFGDDLIDNLAFYGIKTEAVIRKPDASSGIALIAIDETSRDNTIIVSGGANRQLTPEDIKSAKNAIETADILICQLEIPLDSVQTALQIAHDQGVITMLNAAPMCDLPDTVLGLVDHLILNETEAQQLSGYEIKELEDIEQASAILLGKGIDKIVLTMGAKGANVVDADHRHYIPAFPVNVLDTVGAGDAFVGAYAVAIAQGKSLVDALKFGNAVGALATTKPGAQTGSPTAEEIQDFLNSFKKKYFI